MSRADAGRRPGRGGHRDAGHVADRGSRPGAAAARTLGLAVRLAFGGGREQLVRLATTAVGVGLGVALLLIAAVAFPAIRAQDARFAWTETSTQNTRPDRDEAAADPLLWRDRVDSFAGRDIERVDVAPLGPRAPVPPGLTRLPGPGELAVSPALRALLDRTPPEQLADRFPGRITATVGNAALVSPGSLVVFAGQDPAGLRGQPGVDEIRSIESEPRSIALTRFARVLVGVGAAALLMPIVVLIGTATRLSAARREQRLAAMRLVGATPGQVRLVATVEAAIGALAGTILGFVLYVPIRPLAARVDVTGSPFFVADLRLSWASAALVAVGVPVLCAVAAVASLRRVEVSALGVARQATRGRPGWRRLIPLAVGLAGFAVGMPALADADGQVPLWLMAGLMATVIGGIVVAGPWVTMGVGRLLTRLSRSAPTLLAGHRLATSPAAGFRSVSGLVLAVFLVTIAGEATASGLARAHEQSPIQIPHGMVGQVFLGPAAGPVPADRVDALVAGLRGTPGVTGVIDLRSPTGSRADWGDQVTLVTRCAGLRATGLASCPDPSATVGIDARLLGTVELHETDSPAVGTTVEKLPPFALLVATDNRSATIERVRTAIELTAGDSRYLPWTTDELKGRDNTQADMINRLSDTVLLFTLLIAGLSLAISVAGGLVERKRPFALLRLAGMRPGELRRVLFAETAAPLVAVAVISAGLGLAVATDALIVSHGPWRPPAAGYWWVLGGGLVVAVAVAVAATLPLLGRLTSLETARFE